MDLTFKGKKLSSAGCKLAADFSGVHEDSFSMSGLLGVVLLKYLTPIKLSRLMNGVASELAQGFVTLWQHRFAACLEILS